MDAKESYSNIATKNHLLKPVLFFPHAWVRYGPREVKIGGSARTSVPLIFCDQRGEVREEASCYSNLYNPSIKQYKDVEMCITLGNCLFTCLFTVQADLLRMYGTHLWSGPPVYTFSSRNTSSLRPRCPCTRPDCPSGKYNTGLYTSRTIYNQEIQ